MLGVGLVVTTGALHLVHTATDPGPTTEVVVLTAANLAVTVLRFVALRLWVFVRRT